MSSEPPDDDFAFADWLSADAGRVIDETIPFEPDRELAEETDIETPPDEEMASEETIADEVERLEDDYGDIAVAFDPTLDFEEEL